jgi:hypothetical protein
MYNLSTLSILYQHEIYDDLSCSAASTTGYAMKLLTSFWLTPRFSSSYTSYFYWSLSYNNC